MTVTGAARPQVPRGALAGLVPAHLTAAYGPAADAGRAAATGARMKDVAPFLGIPAPARRALSRPAGHRASTPGPTPGRYGPP
ncbi:hypothetical protein AB0F36_21475 [Streptomyces sp. NPDC029080]|uniref:hypothetical protein n=1 Tax=Streptomyces sp. NPDC029080 TaxID=3155017 RepID=UPI0033C00132